MVVWIRRRPLAPPRSKGGANGAKEEREDEEEVGEAEEEEGGVPREEEGSNRKEEGESDCVEFGGGREAGANSQQPSRRRPTVDRDKVSFHRPSLSLSFSCVCVPDHSRRCRRRPHINSLQKGGKREDHSADSPAAADSKRKSSDRSGIREGFLGVGVGALVFFSRRTKSPTRNGTLLHRGVLSQRRHHRYVCFWLKGKTESGKEIGGALTASFLPFSGGRIGRFPLPSYAEKRPYTHSQQKDARRRMREEEAERLLTDRGEEGLGGGARRGGTRPLHTPLHPSTNQPPDETTRTSHKERKGKGALFVTRVLEVAAEAGERREERESLQKRKEGGAECASVLAPVSRRKRKRGDTHTRGKDTH